MRKERKERGSVRELRTQPSPDFPSRSKAKAMQQKYHHLSQQPERQRQEGRKCKSSILGPASLKILCADDGDEMDECKKKRKKSHLSRCPPPSGTRGPPSGKWKKAT